ncbi:MAG: hypothetical protein DRI83_08120 [Bacteroidetes bacterium]|nr:MAG: hypothetical protein DRI83_08120 [Bacteroidota bacterium]
MSRTVLRGEGDSNVPDLPYYHSPIEHMVFFDYQQGRGREGPRKLLTDFKGYLQTDGYEVLCAIAHNAAYVQNIVM